MAARAKNRFTPSIVGRDCGAVMAQHAHSAQRKLTITITGAISIRRQTLDDPVLRLAQAVVETVVQAVGPSLPEFEQQRDDAIAAPMRRAGDGAVLVGAGHLIGTLVEGTASRDDAALLRGPSAELAAARPC